MNKKVIFLIGFCIIIFFVIIAGLLLFHSQKNTEPNNYTNIRNISISIDNNPKLERINSTMKISYSLDYSPNNANEISLEKIEVLDKNTKNLIFIMKENELKEHTHSQIKESKTVINFTYTCPISICPNVIFHRLSFVANETAILPFSIIGGELKLN